MTFVPQDHEHAPKVAATPARQGRWGRHVLWVLIASTVLAAAALFAAWGWRSGDLHRVDTSAARTAAANEQVVRDTGPVNERTP